MKVLELLSQLISFNTESSQSNAEMTAFIKESLLNLGFTENDIHITSTISAQSQEKCNLIAKIGSGTGGLMLAGHMDTVSPGPIDLWTSDPFELSKRHGKLHGLGVCDMKFFLAVSICVAGEISPEKLKIPLSLVFTHDEETSMHGAKILRHDNLIDAEYGIVGEPTSLIPVRLHKGYLDAEFIITGKRGHASNPKNGLNAIEQAHRLLGLLFAYQEDLCDYQNPLLDPPYPTLNVGMISGGENVNKIPGQCLVKIEIRPIPGQSLGDIMDDLKKIAGQMGEFEGRNIAQVKFHAAPTESMETAADSLIVRTVEEISGNQAIGVPFTTEAAIYNSVGVQTVVFGPGNIEQAHQPNEYIEKKVVEQTLDMLRSVIQKICLQAEE